MDAARLADRVRGATAYPQLWEAVRTTWHRVPSERSSLRSLLADHVSHILMNQYREALWPGGNPWDQHAPAVTGRRRRRDRRASTH
ncbi:hypothetical protein [Arthrobacter sp. AQ5-05]|uniref:hypothetical protein n=1 Tax=Arthrobacter sp. AQ5-05 TaxID=2184581 RepID=UPI001E5CBD68|nr:hypothetical protein [Arthrobacter sp. AQ5-05]